MEGTNLLSTILDVVDDCAELLVAEATQPRRLRSRLSDLGWDLPFSGSSSDVLIGAAKEFAASVQAVRATVATQDIAAFIAAIKSVQALLDDLAKLPDALSEGATKLYGG